MAKNNGKDSAKDLFEGQEEVQSAFPEPWDPEEGDEMIGVYMGAEEVPAPRKPGEFFLSYRIDTGESEYPFGRAVSGAMLKAKMSQIPLGSTIKIVFTGYEEVGGGDAKMFKVIPAKGTRLLKPGAAAAAARGNASASVGAGRGKSEDAIS